MAPALALGASALTVAVIELPSTPGYSVRVALPTAERPRLVRPEPTASSVALAAATPPSAAPPSPAELATTAEPAAPQPRKIAGMMALRYSLAGGAEAGDAIEVDKPVTLGGADAGRIPLRIDGNAKVYALGSRLAAIIAAQSGEAAVPAGLDQDFVSLERLRALGIAVRYDPIGDRLVLDPPAA